MFLFLITFLLPGSPCSTDRSGWDSSHCTFLLQTLCCRYESWESFLFHAFNRNIIHTGSPCFHTSTSAVMKMSVFPFPPHISFLPSLEVLRTFLQEIAAVAPTLPFYYYHLPAVTGVKGSSHLILVPFCSHVQSHL